MIRNVSLVNGQTDRLALPYSVFCSVGSTYCNRDKQRFLITGHDGGCIRQGWFCGPLRSPV
jgi:hypothetical protein